MNEITKELLDALKACLKNCARWHPADIIAYRIAKESGK